jgi:hypothetical protein
MLSDSADENDRPKGEESNRNRNNMHNEDLHNLYPSQNTIRVIRQRRIGRPDCEAYVGEIRCI